MSSGWVVEAAKLEHAASSQPKVPLEGIPSPSTSGMWEAHMRVCVAAQDGTTCAPGLQLTMT